MARHHELSHTIESEGDVKTKRQVSSAKSKELSGHDIFADHEDPKPNRSRRSDYTSSASLSQVKNANALPHLVCSGTIRSMRAAWWLKKVY